MVKKESSKKVTSADDHNHEVVEDISISANESMLASTRSVPQFVLDQFWKLSNVDALQRRCAALKLAEALRKESSRDVLQYCLNRLLRGLASDHAAARQGFTAAFACVLPMLLDNLGEQVIATALQKELPVAKKLDSTDATDSAVGRLLACAAIAKSDCEFTSDFNVTLLKGIALLRSCRKAWLELLCSEVYVLTAKKFKKSSFKDHFVPLIQQELNSDWETCTANSLWLLLELHTAYPKIIKHRAVLLKSGTLIETEKTFGPLSEVVEESFRMTPTLHPLVPSLIRHVFQSATIAAFWLNVVENGLLKQNFIERLSIVEAAYPYLTLENVDIVFSAGFFKLLLNMSINAKGKQAKRSILLQFCDHLKQWLSSSENGISSDIAVKMLKNIYMVSPSFDNVSGLKLTQVLLNGIKASSSSEVSINFVLEFLTSPELLRNERDVQTIIGHAVTLASVFHEEKSTEGNLQIALSFFALLAFSTNRSTFQSNGLRLEIPEVWRTNEKFRELAKNAFLRLVDGIFHVSLTPGKLKFTVQPGDLRSLYHVLKTVSKDLPEIQCKTAVNMLKTFTKIHDGEEEDRKILAFRPLLAAVISWTFSQPSEYLAILNELMTCVEKSNGGESPSEEPNWPDVLVDLCIGVCSKPSRFCRAPVCIAIHFLTPILTSAQVDLILQSVDPERAALELDEESDHEFSPIASPISNESVGSEDQMNEGTSSLSSTKSDAEEDESEQSESDEEEQNLMIDPMLREKVRKALGDAALDDVDNEEVERSDLSDSEMMRFDPALSQVFQSQSKEAKKRDREQIVAFRSRCIELLHVIINSKPTSEVLLHMMPVLLKYADAALRTRENLHLYEQLISLNQAILGMKKIPRAKGEELLAAATAILGLMNGVANIKQQKHVGDAFGFLLRMLKHLDESANTSNVEKAIFDMISGAFSEALNNQSAIFPMPILRVSFDRKADLFWPILKPLGACIANSDQRIFLRSEACELAVILIRSSEESTKEKPANRKILVKFSKNILSCLSDFVAAPDTIKPRLFAEILKLVRILSKIPEISSEISAKMGENFEDLTKSGTWNRQPWKKFASPIVKILHKAPYYVVKEILQNARGKKEIASNEENASKEEEEEIPEKKPKLE